MRAKLTEFVPAEKKKESYHKNYNYCSKNSNENQQQRELLWKDNHKSGLIMYTSKSYYHKKKNFKAFKKVAQLFEKFAEIFEIFMDL